MVMLTSKMVDTRVYVASFSDAILQLPCEILVYKLHSDPRHRLQSMPKIDGFETWGM